MRRHIRNQGCQAVEEMVAVHFLAIFLSLALYDGVVLGDDRTNNIVPLKSSLPLRTQTTPLLGEFGLEFGNGW